MYETTRGIVLHVTPYNDTLSVVHIFTERYGRMSYMLPRGTGRAARMARAMYAPLSLIEFEMEYRAGRELQRIREAHTWVALPRLQTDPARLSLVLFIADFLSHALQACEAQPALFAYLVSAVRLLGCIDTPYANFHLAFMVGLMPYLGITPNCEGYRAGDCFDLQEGIFVPRQPLLSPFLPPDEARFLLKLLRIDFANMHLFRFTRAQRARVLDRLLLYYGMHLPGVGTLKSPSVLKAIFD